MLKTIVLTAAALTTVLTLSAAPAAAAQSSKPTPTVQLSAVYGAKYSAGDTVQPMNWVCRVIPCGRR